MNANEFTIGTSDLRKLPKHKVIILIILIIIVRLEGQNEVLPVHQKWETPQQSNLTII